MITKGNMTLFFSEKDPLSNWYKSDFVVKNITFNCVEQFMMYCKAKLFNDHVTADKIMLKSHPRDHKALGRSVAGFIDPVWVERRFPIVVHGLYAKFSQNQALKDVLLGTGDTILVEASPYDAIYGVRLSASDPRILDPKQWRGLNILGEALTCTRLMLVNDLKAGISHVQDGSNMGSSISESRLPIDAIAPN